MIDSMKDQRINHLAVWVMVIVQMFLGGIWYQMVVAKPWAVLSGVGPDDFANFSPVNFIWPLFAAIGLAYVMAWLLLALRVDTVSEAAKTAFLLWLGFLFLEMAALNVMSLRPLALTFLDEGVTLIKYELLAVVFVTWKSYKVAAPVV